MLQLSTYLLSKQTGNCNERGRVLCNSLLNHWTLGFTLSIFCLATAPITIHDVTLKASVFEGFCFNNSEFSEKLVLSMLQNIKDDNVFA